MVQVGYQAALKRGREYGEERISLDMVRKPAMTGTLS
jgi:hypothetical protein